jgi:hypothetical protein
MDLHQLIDDGLETPSPLRLDDHLRAGRRAVRRRRIGALAGTAAAVVVVGALAVVAPGGSPRTAGPATRPPATESSSSWAWEHGDAIAGYGRGGVFEVRPDWRIVERLDDPLWRGIDFDGPGTAEPPEDSVAVTLAKGDRTEWLVTWRSADGGSFATSSRTDVGPGSLRAWAAIQIAQQLGLGTDEVAEVSAAGVIAGRNGVEILDQRRSPELDRPSTVTSVARVRLPATHPVAAWILAVRDLDGIRTYPILAWPRDPEAQEDLPETLDEFVAWIAPRLIEGIYP